MDPSHPCKRVMAHLRVGFEDHLKGIPHEHIRQILSLVLLATSLKAAGQPVGMATSPYPYSSNYLHFPPPPYHYPFAYKWGQFCADRRGVPWPLNDFLQCKAVCGLYNLQPSSVSLI